MRLGENKLARSSLPKSEKQLKLLPLLVPEPLWGKNAARLFGRSALWMQIRRDALESANHACEICFAAEIALDCHEVWEYDDQSGTATLVAFRMQCEKCHLAVHIGRAKKHGKLDVAMAQLRKINGIDSTEAEKLRKEAMADWARRSKLKWRIIVAKSLLERYPKLLALESR